MNLNSRQRIMFCRLITGKFFGAEKFVNLFYFFWGQRSDLLIKAGKTVIFGKISSEKRYRYAIWNGLAGPNPVSVPIGGLGVFKTGLQSMLACSRPQQRNILYNT
jgi:hypothetical protein